MRCLDTSAHSLTTPLEVANIFLLFSLCTWPL